MPDSFSPTTSITASIRIPLIGIWVPIRIEVTRPTSPLNVGDLVSIPDYGTGTITGLIPGPPPSYNIDLDSGQTLNVLVSDLSPITGTPSAFPFSIGERVQVARFGPGTVEGQIPGSPNMYNVRLDTGELFGFPESDLSPITGPISPPGPPLLPPSIFKFNIGDRVTTAGYGVGTIEAQIPGPPITYNVRLDSGQVFNFPEAALSLMSAGPPFPTPVPTPAFKFNVGDHVNVAGLGLGQIAEQFPGPPVSYSVDLNTGGRFIFPESVLSLPSPTFPVPFKFRPGDRVNAPGYGPGTIVSQMTGVPNEYNIRFDSGQTVAFPETVLTLIPGVPGVPGIPGLPSPPATPRLDGPFAALRKYGRTPSILPVAFLFDLVLLPFEISNTLIGFPPITVPSFGLGGFPVPPPTAPTPGQPQLRIILPATDGISYQGVRIDFAAAAFDAQGNDISDKVTWVVLSPSISSGHWADGRYTFIIPNYTGTLTMQAAVTDPGTGEVLADERSMQLLTSPTVGIRAGPY